jgi:hypothetical protein
LVKAFSLVYTDEKGFEHKLFEENNNYQRLKKINKETTVTSITLKFKETWGSSEVHVFSFEVY